MVNEMLNWVIEKKKIVIMLFIMLIGVGILTMLQLPKREVPEIDPPVATITTVYPGATAQQVEQFVTNKIEDELNGITAIETVTSVSSYGVSRLTLELNDKADPERSWNLVRQRLGNVESSFPQDVGTPTLNDELSMQGVAFYHLVGAERQELYQLEPMLEQWEKRLGQVPGVARVELEGLPESQVQIDLQVVKMNALGVTWQQVVQTLEGEVSSIPPGEWQLEERKYRLVLDTFDDPAELISLPMETQQGQLVLGDVAQVIAGFATPSSYISYGDKKALTMTLFMEGGSDVPSLQRSIDREIESLQEQLPGGISLIQVYTQAEPVQELFSQLIKAFIAALISVLIVCSAGLTLPTAMSVALTIPISISIGIIVLPYVGVDMNQISLIAFIVVLGILVDDAIVVNENIERHLQQGVAVKDAAIQGTGQVAISVITSTLAATFTFFPMLFLSGASGGFIRPLPAIVISTILASTLVAFTLIPIFRSVGERSRAGTRKSAGWMGATLDRLANWYGEQVLGKVIAHPKRYALVGLTLGTCAYLLIPLIPLEFFPDTDREEVFVELALPVGTSLEETKERAEQVKDWLNQDQGVVQVSSFVGTNIPRLFGMNIAAAGGSHNANLLIFIDKEVTSTREKVDFWNEKLPELFPHFMVTATQIESGPPVGAPVAIRVSGPEIEQLVELSRQIQMELSKTQGAASISDDLGRQLPTLYFQPNRQAMSQWNVTSRDISQELRLLGDGLELGDFYTGQDLLELRLNYQGGNANQVDLLSQIKLKGEVPLSALVSPATDFSLQQIPHRNGERVVTVRAYPGAKSADEILAAAEAGLERIVAENPQYTVAIAGEMEARTDVFLEMGKIFIAVVFLVLMVITMQFYSLVIPLIIMTTIYLAVAGSVLGLFLTQTSLGFMSMLGAMSLAGIVVRNGIVLIEFIKQSREAGMELEEAVLEAGKKRFRPILLTSMTSIAGLLPLLFTPNPLFQPLATAIIAGLIFSTVLTLVIVPAIYTSWAKFIKT